jgi:hypothetical protein
MTGAVEHGGGGNPPRYKGFPVDMGGVVYVVPAMNAGTIEDYWDRIQALQAGREPMPIMLVVDLMHRALLRNYPHMLRETVRDHIDANNWEEILSMLMGEAGFKQWAELAAAQGNARAQQILTANWPTRSTGAGAPSLPTSPPAPAGPLPTAETS